jgi:hypothetical protein
MNQSVDGRQILSAIDRIYETALEPEHWTGLLRTIGALVGAPQGSLVLMSLEQNHLSDYGFGRNEQFIALFNSEFANEDPWLEPAMRFGPGVVLTGQELCPTPRFQHSAYYEECLKPGEIYDCLGVMLEMGRDLNAGISLHRPPFLPVFGDSEKAALRLLVPHLRRLVQIHRKFESLSAAAVLHTMGRIGTGPGQYCLTRVRRDGIVAAKLNRSPVTCRASRQRPFS